jgi:hypothetical protein
MYKLIILDREKIKILNSSLFFVILSLKKIHKKNIQTHTYTFDYIYIFFFRFLFFSFFPFFFTSIIQNTNSKQLNKNYITITIIAPKQSEITGKLFYRPEQC